MVMASRRHLGADAPTEFLVVPVKAVRKEKPLLPPWVPKVFGYALVAVLVGALAFVLTVLVLILAGDP